MVATYTFHHDRYGEWLEVPFEDVKALGLGVDDFSGYSRISEDGKTLYIESSGDSGDFQTLDLAVQRKEGKSIYLVRELVTCNDGESSPIRKTPRLHADK